MMKTTVVAWKQRASTATVLGRDVYGIAGEPPARPRHEGCTGSMFQASIIYLSVIFSS